MLCCVVGTPNCVDKGMDGWMNNGRCLKEHNGEKKNMAVTQFEPADARRCFPCWDEPAVKVAIVVARELAHQWFGNLLTMEWWTHLWLNEGFATWVSYLATDSLFPEWKIWTQFLDQTTEGLRLDDLAESHPIEVDGLDLLVEYTQKVYSKFENLPCHTSVIETAKNQKVPREQKMSSISHRIF